VQRVQSSVIVDTEETKEILAMPGQSGVCIYVLLRGPDSPGPGCRVRLAGVYANWWIVTRWVV